MWLLVPNTMKSFIRLCILLHVHVCNGSPYSDLVIPRTNWGVIFNKHSVVLNGVSYFKHTMAYSLRELKEEIPSIETILPCPENSIQRSYKCDVFNAFINTVNRITRTELKQHKDKLWNALEVIPMIQTPQGQGGGKRRKRNARRIHTSCRNCTTSIRHGKRRRKSILKSIGRIASDLFQWANKDDVDILMKHVTKLADAVDIQKNRIVHDEQSLQSFELKTEHTVMEQAQSLQDSVRNMKNLRNDMQEVIDQHTGDMRQIENRIKIMNLYLDRMTNLSLLVNEYKTQSNSFKFQIDMTTQSIMSLSTGYIDSYIVNPKKMKEYIDHVQETLKKKYDGLFEVTNTNPAFYYQLRSIVYTRDEDHLYVMLKIPIHNVGGDLTVYSIDSFPVHRSDNNSDQTIIRNLPAYFAVDGKKEFYTHFTSVQYDSCRGVDLKSCSSQFSLKRRSHGHKSCTAALFFDNGEDVMENCDIGLVSSKGSRPDAKTLANGTYLIVGGDPGVDDDWTFQCPDASPSNKVQKVASCVLCMIEVPCLCSLTGSTFFIPYKLTDCPFPPDPDYPSINYLYMLNMPTVRTTFPQEIADEFKADVYKINERWKTIDYPKLQIVHYNMDSVIEADQQRELDYKKFTQKYVNTSKLYDSRESKLSADVRNWKDLQDSEINDLGKLFEHFTNTMDEKSSVLMVSIGTILAIVSIVLSCFVLIKK